jgi:hypothetical protein
MDKKLFISNRDFKTTSIGGGNANRGINSQDPCNFSGSQTQGFKGCKINKRKTLAKNYHRPNKT